MDPVEEQLQEIEVLQSIYPDELELINNTHFSIRINLDVSSTRKHSLKLIVKYPETYPEVIPNLQIEIADPNDDNDEEEGKYEYSDDEDYANDEDDDDEDEESKEIKLALNMAETIEFDRNDFNELLNKLNEESELNLGIPMIFSLITLLKEEAESLFENKLNLKNQEFELKRREKELKEQQKFQGTKVTIESWTKWRNDFRKEMKFEEIDKQRFIKMHNGKLTGKQIFEQGLATTEGDEEIGQDEQDGLIEGIKKI
ncbi:Protein GIR2 [Candida tropicalis]